MPEPPTVLYIFSDWSEPMGRRRHASLALLSAVSYAGVKAGLPFVALPATAVQVRPAAVGPVVLALLFGLPAVAGVVVGELTVALWRTGGLPGLTSLYFAIGVAFQSLLAHAVWTTAAPAADQSNPDMRTATQLATYLLTAVVSSFGRVAVTASSLAILGETLFHVTVSWLLPEVLLASIVLGPILLRLIVPHVDQDFFGAPAPRSIRSVLVLVGVTSLWLLLGSGFSVLLQFLRFVPDWILRRRPVLGFFSMAIGTDGLLLQLVLGVVGTFLLARTTISCLHRARS